MEFFTADIHFSDVNTMKCDNRPFKSIKDYDNFIIKDWNKTAKKGDTIYVIGDLLDSDNDDCCCWKKGLDYIKKIKANVVLIMGNNEYRIVRKFFNNDYDDFVSFCLTKGIKEVHENLVVNSWGKKFFLTHQSKDANPKMITLFGHTHLCSGTYHPYGLCVSTDLNHFRLYTREIIEGYLDRKKKYWEPDSNTNYINPFIKVRNGKVTNIKLKNNKDYQKYLIENDEIKVVKKRTKKAKENLEKQK